MFTLGKFKFQLDKEASELDGGYLMFTIYKRNINDDRNVHNISVLIHSETYEIEPIFFYYANKFGEFKSCSVDNVSKALGIWYTGTDIEGWKFAIPSFDSIAEYMLEYPISRESALTLVKTVCTIRDNYNEYVKKISREVVELQL